MKNKPNQLLFYVPVGIVVYYILYIGLVGYHVIPNYFSSYQFSSYSTLKPIIGNPFTFIPDHEFAPFYIVAGGLGSVGIYIRYIWNKGGYKK